MKVKEFSYDLPNKNIAYNPPVKRGESNLLIINTKNKEIGIDKYYNLDKYLPKDSLVVLNNTKVIPARVLLPSLEIFFLEKHSEDKNIFRVLTKGKYILGKEYIIGDNLKLTFIEKDNTGVCFVRVLKKGKEVSSFNLLVDELNKIGHIALPPYIKRKDEQEDKSRYQTVFAKNIGSVAAPTASLNFTNELGQRIVNNGGVIQYLTLHCGLGTFRTIKVENIEDHKMDKEYYEIPKELVGYLENRKIVAVGTTVTRTLEYYSKTKNIVGEADIFIYPGYHFSYVNSLVTNFHAPNTTPLMLTLAFIADRIAKNNVCEINSEIIKEARELLFSAYNTAIDNDFKFLSYGDSCYIF